MKIAIAHPNAIALGTLQRALENERGRRLLWTTPHAAQVVELASQERPDVLLLDVGFSAPTSVELTRSVVALGPCTVLLLADRPHAHVSAIYEAMGLGAIDVVQLPAHSAASDEYEALRAKLRALAKLLAKATPRRDPSGEQGLSSPRLPMLVALGASTGGPHALYSVLSHLPRDLDAALVIVQHVDREFAQGLADWLQQGSSLRVELARSGSRPTAGTALIAATNDHLVLTANGTFAYTAEPHKLAYRPSVDVLFRSLADHWPMPALAALLTGMGRDGAEGLKRLRSAGWHTIAQDERSSVVFGMPKAAIELAAAAVVLPLERIASAITHACHRT